jgi:hypothetical protein
MTNRRTVLTFLIAALAHLPLLAADRDQGDAGDPIAGAQLAAQMRRMVPATNANWSGVLVRKLPDYTREKTSVTCRIFVEPDKWSAVYDADSTDRSPAEKLTVIHHDEGNVEYFRWIAGTDGQFKGAPVKLRGEETMVPFAGSDFYLSDFGMEFFQWSTQVLLKGQMKRGQPCYVLDSISPQPDGNGYYRVRSWIEKEHLGLMQANAYDVNGKLLKEFRTGSFVKDAAGNYQLKDMDITDRRSGAETELRFDVDR